MTHKSSFGGFYFGGSEVLNSVNIGRMMAHPLLEIGFT